MDNLEYINDLLLLNVPALRGVLLSRMIHKLMHELVFDPLSEVQPSPIQESEGVRTGSWTGPPRGERAPRARMSSLIFGVKAERARAARRPPLEDDPQAHARTRLRPLIRGPTVPHA